MTWYSDLPLGNKINDFGRRTLASAVGWNTRLAVQLHCHMIGILCCCQVWDILLGSTTAGTAGSFCCKPSAVPDYSVHYQENTFSSLYFSHECWVLPRCRYVSELVHWCNKQSMVSQMLLKIWNLWSFMKVVSKNSGLLLAWKLQCLMTCVLEIM